MFSRKLYYTAAFLFSLYLVCSSLKIREGSPSTAIDSHDEGKSPLQPLKPSDSCQESSDIEFQSESQPVDKNGHFSSSMAPLEPHKVTQPPSLPLLHKLKIIEKVAVHQCFQINLLDDDWGHELDIVKKDNPHSVVDVSTGVFQSWLRGSGRQPATWKTVVDVLRECNLNTLADKITCTVSRDDMNVEPLPCSHSREVAGFVKWLKEEYSLKSVVEHLHTVRLDNKLNFVNLTFLNDTNFHLTMGQFLYQVDRLQNEQNKLMVITGDPGSGKTTLMRYLAREWAEGKVLQSCQILFLIYLGESKKEYRSLSDLLRDTEYKDYGDIEQIAKIIRHEHGKGACFLLDAYDERLVNKRDFLEKMISSKSLPHSICIVTSRPSFADKLKQTRHVKIIGFDEEYIEYYVSQLPKEINESVHRLWSKHPDVRQACRSPLYLSLVVYIVALDPNREFSSNTMTPLYLAVMDSLIDHYTTLHPKWNARSLKNCIIQKPLCQDDALCCAFTTLQRVAFDMVFKNVVYFEMEEPSLRDSIKELSIVSIHPVTPNNVTYLFAHRTFAEFFVAFHLTTLPQDELLFYATKYLQKHVVWQFFFGLMGKYYKENVTTISTVFKYYSRVSYGMLDVDIYRGPRDCYQYCGAADNQVPISGRTLRVIQELGWSDNDFYTSIVVNSSVIIDDFLDLDLEFLVKYLFEVAKIHKLYYYRDHYGVITMEDWTQRLNKIHFEFARWSWSSSESSVAPVVLPETTSITFICYHVNDLIKAHELTVQRKRNVFELFSRSNQNCLIIGLTSRMNDEFKNVSIILAPYVTDLELYDSPDNYQILYFNLKNFSSLRTLKLFNPVFDNTSDIQLMCSKLRNSSILHTLELHDQTCEGASEYLDCLSELKCFGLMDSDLSGCSDDLLHHLSQTKRLKTLKICRTKIDIHKLVEILPMLTNLEELYLEYSVLNDSDISMLSFALKTLTLLNTLHLGSEFMTDTSVRTLANALSSESHKTFRKLKLRYNFIGKNVSDFLKLSQLTGLTHLSIQPTNQFENLVDIVKVLGYLPRLTHLCWSADALTDEEKYILFRVMSNLPHLLYNNFYSRLFTLAT